ncbi:helix-turn-helix domain-containing protein [Planctomycetales bacterium ZRK34]|nr:helix-turn-helix domain-containing protein [Planctomycetales bacterium ZRK34]
MAQLATVLKQEIRRLARREITSANSTLRKQSAQYRRDVADLKRQVADLTRRLDFLERQEKRRITKTPSPQAAERVAENARFSPKWLSSHRKKLGLSAADYSKLVGVSGLTIYNWEHGKSKPRAKQLAQWVAVRDLGKREALKRLDMIEK